MHNYMFLLLILNSVFVFSYKKNWMFTLPAGENRCFTKKIKKGKVIEVSYKMKESSNEEASVAFELTAPGGGGGQSVVARLSPAGAHALQAGAGGRHRFCFDNLDLYRKRIITMSLHIHSKSSKKKTHDFADVAARIWKRSRVGSLHYYTPEKRAPAELVPASLLARLRTVDLDQVQELSGAGERNRTYQIHRDAVDAWSEAENTRLKENESSDLRLSME